VEGVPLNAQGTELVVKVARQLSYVFIAEAGQVLGLLPCLQERVPRHTPKVTPRMITAITTHTAIIMYILFFSFGLPGPQMVEPEEILHI